MEIDFEHLDMDWYGKDADGNFGVFYSNGGIVPFEVVDCMNKHKNVSLLIKGANSGSKEYWEDDALAGFYVFEWNPYNNLYKKLGNARGTIAQLIQDELAKITRFREFEAKFYDSQTLEVSNFEF